MTSHADHRPVLVVGGGIAGLVAAHDLAAAGIRVLLLESTDRVGGKIRAGEVAGITVDVGAEAMVNRRPEGVELAASLGLDVVHPTAATSRIWVRDALRPLPRTLMGAPLDLDQLAASGILEEAAVARAREEQSLPATELAADADIALGDLIDARYGAQVTDLLLEPLLGGVYAGRAREISARAAMPQLLALARRGSITAQAEQVSAPASAAGPVFAGLPGGMSRLPEALARAVTDSGHGEIRTGAVVTALRRSAGQGDGRRDGLVAVVDSADGREEVHAPGVVVATPAAAASRLLADVAETASADLATVATASMAVVTLALPARDAGAALDVGASGFLVPPVEGRRIKAATFSFAKWEWVRAAGAADASTGRDDDLLVLRTSVGRIGEEHLLQVDDTALVEASLADLCAATGLGATVRPVDAHVQRWGGGLPQYALGHTDRVARIRAAVADVPGLALAGATYDGVGIAPTIGSAHRAVASLLQHLRPA